jgi:hypothetical protein
LYLISTQTNGRYIQYETLQIEKKNTVEQWRAERITSVGAVSLEQVAPLPSEDLSYEEEVKAEQRRVETKEKLRQWRVEKEAERARRQVGSLVLLNNSGGNSYV